MPAILDRPPRVEVQLARAEATSMDAVSDAANRKRGEIFRQLDRREITATVAYERIHADLCACEVLYRSILGDERFEQWSDGVSIASFIDRDAFLCAHGRGMETVLPRLRRWVRIDLSDFLHRWSPRSAAALRRLCGT